MARVPIRPSQRGSALIASIVAASIAGFVALFPGSAPVHDDVALAIRILQPWEGRSLKAYLDRHPKVPVWTICDGDTENVSPGMVTTHADCDARVARRMEREFRPQLAACIPQWDEKPLALRGSMLSLAWNIGTGAASRDKKGGVCNSTAARLARQGDYRAACEAATAFVKSGGKELPGLVARRGMGDAQRPGEGEVCASGT